MGLRRAAFNNSLSGLCITKLDVLDGLDAVQICTGYQCNGETLQVPPVGADALADCKPVYEEWPGWSDSTVGVRDYDKLPQAARNYLNRLEEITETPIDIISTGPDRADTIILRDPFSV